MTGRYNFRNYERFGALPKNEFTFGHMMQDAGSAIATAAPSAAHGSSHIPWAPYCHRNIPAIKHTTPIA